MKEKKRRMERGKEGMTEGEGGWEVGGRKRREREVMSAGNLLILPFSLFLVFPRKIERMYLSLFHCT